MRNSISENRLAIHAIAGWYVVLLEERKIALKVGINLTDLSNSN